MNVLTIGSDRNLFKEGSAVRQRVVEYGRLFDELHIIVFTPKVLSLHPPERLKTVVSRAGATRYTLSENVWIYPTNSFSRWFYIWDAIHIGMKLIQDSKFRIQDGSSKKNKLTTNNWLIDSQDPFECGFAASRIARRLNLPLHVQIHTDFLSPYFARGSFLNRIRILIANFVLPKASGIRVVSQRIKDSLLNATRYTLHAVPVVLPIFTDVEKLRETPITINLHKKYPQFEKIILIVSRLSPEKNISFAIDVMREILKRYPKAGLIVVGEGSELSSLKLKVKSYRLEASVAFEGWQNNLSSYYKSADIFLHTSIYDGFGLAILESVVCGLPTVSSDVGIAPELLNHKGHSFICPVNDLACFVSIVSKLIEDSLLRTFFYTKITPAAVLKFNQSKKGYLEAYRASIESSQP